MKALVLQDIPSKQVVVKDVDIDELCDGDVLIKMRTAALNRRDEWCRQGLYGGMKYPSILGSDGCGIVEEVFSEKDNHWIGKEVIINPNNNWGDNPNFQSKAYHILGMPTNGTFAEYLVVNSDRLVQKPVFLNHEEAACIPLAGLTAFRAVFTRGNAKPNQNILISGIGGGVAQFAFSFTKAIGANVWVTSGNDEKIAKMKTLGASGGVNYKNKDWEKDLLNQTNNKGFDLVIDSAGGDGFNKLIKVLKPCGTLVFYGATLGSPSSLNMTKVFFRQLNIKGSTMGNDEEFEQMVDFVERHKVKPLISSVRPLNEVVSAFDEMRENKHFGKLVIKIF